MTRIAAIALVGLALFLPPLAGLAAAPRGADGPVLVLHAPWSDGAHIVQAAGGQPIGPAKGLLGTLAAAHDTWAFRGRLRDAGAWAAIDAGAFLAFCAIDPAEAAAAPHRPTTTPEPDPQP